MDAQVSPEAGMPGATDTGTSCAADSCPRADPSSSGASSQSAWNAVIV